MHCMQSACVAAFLLCMLAAACAEQHISNHARQGEGAEEEWCMPSTIYYEDLNARDGFDGGGPVHERWSGWLWYDNSTARLRYKREATPSDGNQGYIKGQLGKYITYQGQEHFLLYLSNMREIGLCECFFLPSPDKFYVPDICIGGNRTYDSENLVLLRASNSFDTSEGTLEIRYEITINPTDEKKHIGLFELFYGSFTMNSTSSPSKDMLSEIFSNIKTTVSDSDFEIPDSWKCPPLNECRESTTVEGYGDGNADIASKLLGDSMKPMQLLAKALSRN